MEKSYEARVGEVTHTFSFLATNLGTTEIVIDKIRPSCGCTVAKMPAKPWRLAPESSGIVQVTVNFAGKFGIVRKTLLVDSTHGPQVLTIQVNVPILTTTATAQEKRRLNLEEARADRQSVFRGTCAQCHGSPVVEKARTGEDLWRGVCMVCHETPNRASMVPDLAGLHLYRNEAYWRTWIAEGRKGTLMPAFALARGGPLNVDQINALVGFLMTTQAEQ